MGAAADVPLQKIDHGTKHFLKGPFGSLAAARHCGQRDHGAGIFDVLEMLAGQIRADDLRREARGFPIDLDSLPMVFPVRIGEEAGKHLCVKAALAFEVAVETAARQACAGHDLIDGYILETSAVE